MRRWFNFPYLTVHLMTFALLLAFTVAAQGAELGGVKMDDSSKVGDQTLVLNGLGLRKKAIFKVYVGGLYLASKSSQPEKILAADGSRRMVLEFVRSVDAEAIGGAWTDCLDANVKSPSSELKTQFGKLSSWMENVSSGDQLTFTYHAGAATHVEVKGKAKGSLDGKAFADALFSCWIGPHPPSEDFKMGLLGK